MPHKPLLNTSQPHRQINCLSGVRGHHSIESIRSLANHRASHSQKSFYGGCKPKRRTQLCTQAVSETTVRKDPEVKLKPAFKKYLDAAGLARYNYHEWQRLAGDGVEIPPPTVYTILIYPLQFVKYNFVPELVRYGWYLVWIRLVAAYAPFHRKIILQGAKLDAYLQHKGHPERPMQIDRKTALFRYHWKISPVRSLALRLGLLKAAIPRMLFSYRQKNIQQAEESSLPIPKII